MENKILYVRLPCNPIFPLGVVYLADHVHKLFENVEQRILDLGTVPPLDYKPALDACIDEFKPTLLIYSWRDIHIFAPVGGRGGNPLQYSFEIFYAKNPFVKLHGALGGVQMLKGFYTELWRREKIIIVKNEMDEMQRTSQLVTSGIIIAILLVFISQFFLIMLPLINSLNELQKGASENWIW